MYKYRIYLEKEFGYELYKFIYDIEELYEELDYFILEENYKNKILVIKYDKELNQDSTFYLYTGYCIPTLTEYKNIRKEYEMEKQRVQSRIKKR